MFGEQTIYGVTESTVDHKGRLWLPKFTHAEEGDILLVIKKEDLILIANEQDVTPLLDELETHIFYEQDQTKKDFLQSRLYELYERIVKKCIVDKQNRIVLGDNVENNCKYKVIGAKKEIILKKL